MKQILYISLALLLASYTLLGSIGVTEFGYICGGKETTSLFTEVESCCSDKMIEGDGQCHNMTNCCHMTSDYWALEFHFYQHAPIFDFAAYTLSYKAYQITFNPIIIFSEYINGFADKSPPPKLYGQLIIRNFCTYLI